jgi:hypothetical protein
MKKTTTKILVAILVIGIIIVLIAPVTSFDNQTVITPNPNNPPRNDIADPNLNATTTTNPADHSDLIVVTSPTQNSTVSSPLTVTGRARGSWYFEASFPIELVNESTGLVIARGIAQAEGEWMTTNFVPFKATLTFPRPATTTKAQLILRNDNPSGDPERDKSVIIPVTVR